MFVLTSVVLMPHIFVFEPLFISKCKSTTKTICKKGKPTIRSVVFVFMGLTLVVVCELVDGDEGVIIGFEEQVDH